MPANGRRDLIRRLKVKQLRYKPEGRGFDSMWGHWDFSLVYSFQPHYGPGVVDSASNRNEYQEYFLGAKGGRSVGREPCHLYAPIVYKFWQHQPPEAPRVCQA